MKGKKWCVYILECLDGSYYTGVTNVIKKRMNAHELGKGSKYVRSRGFSHLIAERACKSRSDAFKIEYKIKQMPKKEKLSFFREELSVWF